MNNFFEGVLEILNMPAKAREISRVSNAVADEALDLNWREFERRLSSHIGVDNARIIVGRMRREQAEPEKYEMTHIGDWVSDYLVHWPPEHRKEMG